MYLYDKKDLTRLAHVTITYTFYIGTDKQFYHGHKKDDIWVSYVSLYINNN